METEEQTLKLKAEFERIIAEPPFNGKVTHNTRALFVQRWKEFMKAQGIKGDAWLNDLIKMLKQKAPPS